MDYRLTDEEIGVVEEDIFQKLRVEVRGPFLSKKDQVDWIKVRVYKAIADAASEKAFPAGVAKGAWDVQAMLEQSQQTFDQTPIWPSDAVRDWLLSQGIERGEG